MSDLTPQNRHDHDPTTGEAAPPLSRREAREREQALADAQARAAAQQEQQHLSRPSAPEQAPAAPTTAASAAAAPAATAPIAAPASAPLPAIQDADGGADRHLGTDAILTALGTSAAEQEHHAPHRGQRRAKSGDGAPPRKRRGRRGLIALIVSIVVVGGLAACAAVVWTSYEPQIRKVLGWVEPNDYTGTGTTDVTVQIHAGDIGEDIANTLHKAGVTKSFDAFYNLLLAQKTQPEFFPGAFQLKKQMSAKAALDALLDDANRLKDTVVVPEGTVEQDVLASISETSGIPLAEIQAAAADPSAYGLPPEAKTLEGFLFPATYTLQQGASAHDIIKMFVDRSFEALDSAGVAPANRWKTIVLASLVQKEAGLKDDYYKVARVFLNRLDPAQWDSGLLQSDATVAYGTGNTHRVSTTDAEREDASNPYNTYVHPGMVVGPISNPGDLAIDAALHPAEGPWLYFVTWNLDTGETIFSTTGEEHQAAVDKWLAWMDQHPEYK